MTEDLSTLTLLATLQPELRADAFVFAVVSEVPAKADYVAVVVEPEGNTMILLQSVAERAGYSYDFVAAMITLNVHSALTSVGLTAAVSTVLARAGISCNVVAGTFHDHLFVPFDRGQESLELLEEQSKLAQRAVWGSAD